MPGRRLDTWTERSPSSAWRLVGPSRLLRPSAVMRLLANTELVDTFKSFAQIQYSLVAALLRSAQDDVAPLSRILLGQRLSCPQPLLSSTWTGTRMGQDHIHPDLVVAVGATKFEPDLLAWLVAGCRAVVAGFHQLGCGVACFDGSLGHCDWRGIVRWSSEKKRCAFNGSQVGSGWDNRGITGG